MQAAGLFFKIKYSGGVLDQMKDLNPLETVHGTIIAGVVLAIVLTFIVKWLAGA
jgi:hypothetical protein